MRNGVNRKPWRESGRENEHRGGGWVEVVTAGGWVSRGKLHEGADYCL